MLLSQLSATLLAPIVSLLCPRGFELSGIGCAPVMQLQFRGSFCEPFKASHSKILLERDIQPFLFYPQQTSWHTTNALIAPSFNNV
ncbi:hypothetical protein C8J56DRAFT_936956 [Mycena floridula]|nr:hypothetical protein C8J56DRAFT_936956 [Mycena floridula]